MGMVRFGVYPCRADSITKQTSSRTTMGLFDQLMGQVLGGAGSSGGSNPMMKLMMSVLNNPAAVQGVVQLFKDKGLGQVADSWVGTGPNLPVSGDQVQQALGNQQVEALAARLGLSAGDASSQLATLLPEVVNALTPNGKVEGGEVFQKALGGLLGGGR